MRDDFLSADWSRHHAEMSKGIDRLIDTILVAFKALHSYQFDAPWKHAGCDATE